MWFLFYLLFLHHPRVGHEMRLHSDHLQCCTWFKIGGLFLFLSYSFFCCVLYFILIYFIIIPSRYPCLTQLSAVRNTPTLYSVNLCRSITTMMIIIKSKRKKLYIISTMSIDATPYPDQVTKNCVLPPSVMGPWLS